ncbi:hypothetical protein TcWFU_006764 [Taenia crassiceps]|uniref:Uncharacterized protein n=1 Tax=Taenia crassiceps TaxID=6207 RepID=A0ABR4QLY6_9CEST
MKSILYSNSLFKIETRRKHVGGPSIGPGTKSKGYADNSQYRKESAHGNAGTPFLQPFLVGTDCGIVHTLASNEPTQHLVGYIQSIDSDIAPLYEAPSSTNFLDANTSQSLYGHLGHVEKIYADLKRMIPLTLLSGALGFRRMCVICTSLKEPHFTAIDP